MPIYQGKIDKTLFQAQLEAHRARCPQPLLARASSRLARARAACLRGRAAAFCGRGSSGLPLRRRRRSPRSASIRSITGASGAGLRLRDLLARELRLEHLAQVAPVLARAAPADRTRRRGCRSPAARGRARRPSRRSPPTASSISACEWTSSARNSVSSASASPCGRIEAERSRCPRSTNRPIAAIAGLLHRARAAARTAGAAPARARRHEEVRAVEVDRVDLVERHEPLDLDRARVVCALDRLEILVLDDHELALRDLPALDDLVGADLALVHRAPALLLDRRPALAVQRAGTTTSDCRAAGFVAGARPTGMLTRPKLIDPFQIVRIARLRSLEGPASFAAPRPFPRTAIRSARDRGRSRERSRAALRRAAHDRALWQDAIASAGQRRRTSSSTTDGWQRGVAGTRRRARVDELANGLLALGIRKGDAFAILGPTTLEWALFDFALAPSARSASPIYPNSSAEGRRVHPRALGGGRRARARTTSSAPRSEPRRAPAPRARAHVRRPRRARAARAARYAARASRRARATREAAVDEDDLFTFIYTSGTTGPPKACMIPHRNYYEMVSVVDELDDFVARGRHDAALPAARAQLRPADAPARPVRRLHDRVPRPTRCARAEALPAGAADGLPERAARLREGAHAASSPSSTRRPASSAS